MLSLAAPFLYAVTNFIDKVLLERYFTEGGVGTLLIVSAVLSGFALPILYAFDNDVLNVDLRSLGVLAFVSALHVLVLFLYLKALQAEDVSVTVVFYQLVPVFGLLLGYLILGETVTYRQGTAMTLIIAGSSIMSLNYDRSRRLHFRRQTVGYMLGASVCWALGSVIFKAVALEATVVRSLFWEHAMLAVIGGVLFLFVRSYRHQFLRAIVCNSRPVLGLNVLNEALYILGNVIFAFAYMLGPIAVVLLAQSFQPAFALLIGVAATILVPSIVKEKVQFGHVLQRTVAIGLTCLGSYYLLIGEKD